MLLIPGPVEVPHSVMKRASEIGNHRSNEFREAVYQLESLMKEFFDSDRVAILSGSGTLAVETMIFSMVEPNEKVVSFTYGEFGNRMIDSLKRRKAKVYVVDKPFGETVTINDVDTALDKYSPSTVTLVHNETSTGVAIRNLRDLVGHIRKKGVKILVDSVSGFAGHEIRLNEWGIDAAVTGSQKALASVPGISFVAVSKKAEVKQRDDIPVYTDLSNYLRFQDRGENPFTPAVGPLFASLRAAEILKDEGIENRIRRHEACMKITRSQFKSWGYKLIGDEEDFSNTVLAVETGNFTDEIISKLKERNIEIARGMRNMARNTVRLGLMGMVNNDMIDVLLSSWAEIAGLKYEKVHDIYCELPEFLKSEISW
ncbi:hydrogenase expression protein HypE [Sulfolobales archaeon HS-7]|nr:hydrogenase expression protein HypE [Sulfolobales archaeon HS-7]